MKLNLSQTYQAYIRCYRACHWRWSVAYLMEGLQTEELILTQVRVRVDLMQSSIQKISVTRGCFHCLW